MNLTPKEEAVLDIIQQDSVYEDYFLKKITETKWFFPLKEKGFFSSEKAPGHKPADKEGYWTIPRWNVLDYLEKVSQQVNMPGNEIYADELLKIIRDVTDYHIKNNKCLDNYYTWWSFIKIISNLPNNKITLKDIELIPHWLDSKFDNRLQSEEILEKLLPKFLNSNDTEDIKKAERIIEIITEIKWIPKYDEKEPKTSLPNSAWLLETPEGIKLVDMIAEKSNEKIIFIFADRLKEIFDEKYKVKEGDKKYDLSYIWFKSLYEPPGYIDSTEEVFTLILKNILLKRSNNDTELIKRVIERFLNEYDYPLFKRFVLFIIGNNWNLHKEFFRKMIDEDKNAELFNDITYEPEIYKLLQLNVSYLTEEEKRKIKEIIEEKVPDKIYQENKEYYTAYVRQRWYSALKSDTYFLPFYEKYRNITGKEEKIDFKGIKTRVGPGASPLTKEQILNMSNSELSAFLKEFKTGNWWEDPTINGLSEILKSYAQEKPEKFIDDLKPFLNTGYLYVYNILWGIRDAYENGKIIDWNKLFNFIKEYITYKDFWSDKYKVEGDKWEANHLWVVGMISEIIKAGTYDDSWAFPEKYFQISQEILFLMLDKIMLEKEKIVKDYSTIEDFLTYALNSSFGKTTEALFILALRIRRFEEKVRIKQSVSWEANIEDKYDNLMNSEIIETYVWFGRYLPNFYYIDKKWTEDKIKTFDINKKYLWEAFIEGYSSAGIVYYELYNLMQQHYEKAIDYKFKHETTSIRIIQHICLEYLREIEDINNKNGLFRKLLDNWEIYQIKEMINFFWSYGINYKKELKSNSDKKFEEIKNKIINFWKFIYETKYKGKQENEFNNNDKKILSELSLLSVFLPEINSENSEWLKLSVLFFDEYVHSSLFIEYLDNLKDKAENPGLIGDIYLEILKNSTPYIRRDEIKSIVEFLYQKGSKEKADKICNIYAERGFLFLRSIYEKYNI